MRKLFLSMILIFIIISCVSATEISGLEGQWALYELKDVQPFRRLGKGKKAPLLFFEQVKSLALDTEILIGTSRSFRNDRSGRIYGPRSDWSGLEEDYTYVPLTQEDYHKMIDAGMNIFRVPLDHPPWGYLCDHYQMKHYTGVESTFTQGGMWWSNSNILWI